MDEKCPVIVENQQIFYYNRAFFALD